MLGWNSSGVLLFEITTRGMNTGSVLPVWMANRMILQKVFGAIAVQERRVPDLFESQIGRRPDVLIVIIDDI